MGLVQPCAAVPLVKPAYTVECSCGNSARPETLLGEATKGDCFEPSLAATLDLFHDHVRRPRYRAILSLMAWKQILALNFSLMPRP